MSYDPNSLETQKGKLGEKIIRRFYDERGAVVQRPDGIPEGQASLIDFHVEADGESTVEEHLAEVKVRNAMQYAFGRYPCYTIPVAQVELYKKYASDHNLPLVLWFVAPKEGKMYSGELAPWGLENTVTIDGKDFPFDQHTKCGNMRFYHRRQFIEYDLDERDLRKFKQLEESYALKNEEPENELEKRCTKYFGKPFAKNVRDRLRELQQEFSDDDIFNAICDVDIGDANVIIEKCLTDSPSETIADILRNFVHARIVEAAKSADTIRVEEPTISKFVDAPAQQEQPAFTPPVAPTQKSPNSPVLPDELAKRLPSALTYVVKTLTTPAGTRIDLLKADGRETIFVTGRQLSKALGFTTQCETFTSRGGLYPERLWCPVTNGNNGVRVLSMDCFSIGDALSALETYKEKTYGARQGSAKYNRHMEVTRLAVWWKNVVLEGET